MRGAGPLLGLGLILVAVAGLIGGGGSAIGGGVALATQLVAVALLRPGMEAAQPEFMRRWLAGLAIRALAVVALIVVSATHRAALPLLETSLGFLGVLLPLLFLETRFLK